MNCSKCSAPHQRADQRYCLSCHATYQRNWRKTHPNQLKLTPDRMAALLEAKGWIVVQPNAARETNLT